jgi:hypothetical protein
MRRADRNAYAASDALTQYRAVRWTHAQHARLSASCERKRVDRLCHSEQIYIVGYKSCDEVAAMPQGVPLEDCGKLP